MITIKTKKELKAEKERQLKAWLEAGDDVKYFRLNLEGDNLRGSNLTGADLTGAFLWECNLTNANLTGADLREAKFDSHQLVRAKIKDTIITQSQYNELARLYSQEFMAGFIVKELEVVK